MNCVKVSRLFKFSVNCFPDSLFFFNNKRESRKLNQKLKVCSIFLAQ